MIMNWTQLINHLKLYGEPYEVGPSYGHIVRNFYIELKNFDNHLIQHNDASKIYKNLNNSYCRHKILADLNTDELINKNTLHNN